MVPSNDILVFVEYRDHEVIPVTLEMLSEARRLVQPLNGKVCACLLGYEVREYLPLLQDYGAQKVYLLDNCIFSGCSLDVFARALQNLIEEHQPLLIMFSATSTGSEVATRVAGRLKLPCITEVKRIWAEGKNLAISKPCYEDKVYQHFDFRPGKTVVVTALPGDMESGKLHGSIEIEIVDEAIRPKIERTYTRSLKFIKGDPRRISIEEADLIVAGGKGIGKDLSILEELADILGASIGGTRPLVDDGIIAFERQIGITGKSVTPKLLITCGISGAREFAAGIEKARLTFSINADPNAPIFKIADLGIIGDLHMIVPLIIDRVKKYKQDMEKAKGHKLDPHYGIFSKEQY